MATASRSDLMVNISGCVWSSLAFDHAGSMGDQEGFLFGEVVTQTNTDISDSQMTKETEQISINVYSHYACSEPYSFYDRRGYIDQVKLISLLKSKYKRTIGWYRFRRNTTLQPSMREGVLHRQLVDLLRANTPNLFLLGLFTSAVTWNQSTHSFNHQLLTLRDRAFGCVQVQVINLGNTSHSEYKTTPGSATATKSGGVYSDILHKFRNRLVDFDGKLQGVHDIQGINNSIYSQMQVLKDKISEGEKRLQKEIEEVQELQQQKKKKEQAEAQRRLEQHQPLTADRISRVQPSTPLLDTPVLQTATVCHPTRQHQTAPQVPTLTAHQAPLVSVAASTTTGTLNGTHSKMGLRREPLLPNVVTSSTDDDASSSSDPFAGLLKDMKKSIQKPVRDEDLPSDSKRGERSTRARSWDRNAERAKSGVPSPGKHKAHNSTNVPRIQTTSPRKKTGAKTTSPPAKWQSNDSEELTQLPQYDFSLSPTF